LCKTQIYFGVQRDNAKQHVKRDNKNVKRLMDSHGSRTPLPMSNFGCGHGSRWSLSNLPLITARPKSPGRHKKAKISVGFVEIWGVSRQIFVGVEMSNLKKGSRVTPPCRF
jgi:hypothetical protein